MSSGTLSNFTIFPMQWQQLWRHNGTRQGMRCATTFNLLHEATLLKETAGTPTPTLATATTTQRLAMVHNEALTELHRLQALPPSSHKWIWGEQLTEQEVLCLRQTGTQPGRTPHSGYDVSLIEGRMLGEYSQTQSYPTSHGHPEEVASSIASVPCQWTSTFPVISHEKTAGLMTLCTSINHYPYNNIYPASLSQHSLCQRWSRHRSQHTSRERSMCRGQS